MPSLLKSSDCWDTLKLIKSTWVLYVLPQLCCGQSHHSSIKTTVYSVKLSELATETFSKQISITNQSDKTISSVTKYKVNSICYVITTIRMNPHDLKRE